ncbi:unnamed protein product [Larinioides sclopetarius]
MPCTILADILQAKINIDNKNVSLILCAPAVQEIFRTSVRNYMKTASGVLLVYDVTRLDTFAELPRWLFDLRTENETAPVMIVANKIDEVDSQRRVPVEMAKEFADQHKLDFMEASAKTGENVDEIFERLTRKGLKSISMSGTMDPMNASATVHSSKSTHGNNSRISLHEKKPTQKPKSKCC